MSSKNYKVTCDCTTPLDANPFLVEAENEPDAVAKFKSRNGIVSTDHPITVTPEASESVQKLEKTEQPTKHTAKKNAPTASDSREHPQSN